MNSEWTFTTIGEQLTLQRGFDITKAVQQPGNVPVISSGGTNSYHSTAMVKGPGVVLGRKGVVGSVYFVNEDYWPHDTTLWIKDFHGNDELFAYYFFLANSDVLARLDVGSANPTLNRNHVHPIRVQWPALREQRLIGRLLGVLDDRITLLRETNTTLETVAQALFKSWFVDFEPVRAKVEGLEPQGMDAATAALFPDGFEESELGLVPTGWEIGSVGNLAVQKKGSVNPLSKPDDWFEHFSLPAFDNAQTPVFEQGGAIKSNKTPLPMNAVLLSKLNPHIPRVWLPVSYGCNAVCSTEFLAYSPEGASSKELIYCLFKAPEFQQQLCQLVTGTSNSHQRVKPEHVISVRVVVASQELLFAFSSLVKPLFEQVYANRKQAQTLSQLRDTLLPRLISGQLRLPEAEELVEEACA
jgi:type I restriction enzyme S subunit